jgi:hypothetical protein
VQLAAARTGSIFERSVRHLAWFALLAVLAVSASLAEPVDQSSARFSIMLAVLVLVVVVWSLVRRSAEFVRTEQRRRQRAADASRRLGACLAADQINDRVSNWLSITYGYAEFLAEDPRLPSDAHEQAARAMDAARQAARAVSEFRAASGCGNSDALMARVEAETADD